MSVTITCPKCRAGLKANRLPPANQPIQCVRCKHRFIPSDIAPGETDSVQADGVQAGKSLKIAKPVSPVSTKATPKIAAPVKRPAASGLRWHHGVIAAMVGLVLIGGGVAGSWWLMQPQTETSVAHDRRSSEPLHPKVVSGRPRRSRTRKSNRWRRRIRIARSSKRSSSRL